MKANNLSVDILRATINSVAESFVLISPDHQVLICNTAMVKTLEIFFGKEIQIGDDYRDFVVEPLMEIYFAAFESAIKGESTTVQKETSGGEVHLWFEYKANPVYDDARNLIGVAIYAKNIDEQKKAELALEYLKTTYESLINNISDSICLLDTNFKLIQFNTHFQKSISLNIGKEINIGDDFREYLFPKETDAFYTQFNSAISGKTVEDEICVHDIYGKTIWILSKMYPVYDKNQSIIGVCLVAINISAKKKMELAILENEQRFRKIIETAPVPIVIVDKKMKIQLVNPETEKIFNYESKELLDQDINILIPKRFHSNHAQYQQQYIQAPQMYRMGIGRFTPAITKDGIEKIVEVSLNSFRVNDETFILAIIQDVTKRIEHETQLENQVETLEKIAWQQSHEMRKPVANILGLVQLIEYDKAYNPLLINQLHQTTKELDDVIHKIVNLTHTNR
ncbi:PAS domain S-box protein [Flectobacillus sp. DC10W]|jgi:PAS domain S-box-containing protein|uniref:histidine kinase n=1 Tax=Flectobacillus longus TaxID=2984207 RepID=A0ABT6YKR8_9BACT|nr:PAS domain S-box protein [Flectobacillus longus]MDI9864184.1 PAS domain S-box protein [Flectobacillus longus]